MVSMAASRALPEVLEAMVKGITVCKKVAVARVWLIAAGDICATCQMRDECPDQTRCLHLVASAGSSNTGQDMKSLDAKFIRFPIGARIIGRIAASGEPLNVPNLTGDEEWLIDGEWVRREGVATFAGHPLVFRGETLGVLAILDRGVLTQEDFDWLRIFADYVAVSIANANAFEEIAYLKERLQEENNYLREEVTTALGFGDLIGESAALRKVIQQIELVGVSDATVLITGESGTGKELLARALHERSTRRDRALIKVNCAAVPETLFESEFFGHVKGSFTGAIRDKAGRFEMADGGTLFLDEIGEVPLAMQAKLLRVIQEQEVERVGDNRSRKLNVRIIAATNRNLKAEVEAGRFRQDLFYRLSVFPIESPPLRGRRDDIPRLAEHFIRAAAKRLNRRPPRLTAPVAQQLAAHDWPGNVRELQNAVERAVILSRGGPLEFDMLGSSGPPSLPNPAVEKSAILTRAELKQRERESIVAALAESGGKIFGPNGAASLLGMKPTTLASKIQALGIRRKTELRDIVAPGNLTS
jgi:transcriptional regulator with GAF, ATPase, and Fis domain